MAQRPEGWRQSISILRDSNRWIGLIWTRMSGKRSSGFSRWR